MQAKRDKNYEKELGTWIEQVMGLYLVSSDTVPRFQERNWSLKILQTL
jgi:hypothetical protein